MDPLAIVTGVITLSGALLATLNVIKSACGASDDICALINEVSDTQIVLKSIEPLLPSTVTHNPSEDVPGLLKFLQDAKSNTTKLQVVVDRCIEKQTTGIPKVKRARWIKEKSMAADLRAEMYRIRSNITSLLVADTRRGFQPIELALKEIIVVHQERSTRLDSLVEKQNQTLAALVSQVSSLKLSGPGVILPTTVPQNPVQAIGIRMSQDQGLKCEQGCSCACHVHYRLQTPRFMDRLMGSLFIGYSGYPMSKAPCNEYRCRARGTAKAQFTYYFPPWFLAQRMSLTVITTQLGALGVTLIPSRIRSDDADIFRYAVLGNLDGIKTLFQQSLASPHDVNFSSGIAALNFAVQGYRIDLCKFLLNCGADPSLESRSRISAIDKAWDCIFAKSTDTTTEQALGELFPNSDYIERRRFGRLHKIVIGLLGDDLERELELSTSTINDTDSRERTALSWAAARGDKHAVCTLLRYNANPNTASIAGNSPLLLAARASRPEAIKPLLEAGAWIGWKNSWQYTALHYAAYYQKTEDHLRPLLEAGADVNAKDAYGSSPLAVTVDYGQTESARILLDYGANIESRDCTGYTPLLRCIEWNSHQILRLLLGRQAKYTVRTSRGDTILHLAANRGDLNTITILTEAGLRDVDSEATNHKGFTAEDLLSRRFDTSVEIRTTMEKLLSTVRNANAGSGNPTLNTEFCGEECSTEVFEDAVEQQVQ